MKAKMKDLAQKYCNITQKNWKSHAIVGFLLLAQFIAFFTICSNPTASKKQLLLFLMCFAVSVVALVFKNNFSKSTNAVLTVLFAEIVPLCLFVALETFTKSSLTKMSLIKIILNLLIFVMIYAFFFVISWSLRVAVIGLCAVISVYGIANYFVFAFRQIPLLASDFSIMGTAMNVLGQYDLTPNASCFLMIMFSFMVAIIAFKLPKLPKVAFWKRIGCGLIYVCIFVCFTKVTLYSDNFTKWKIYLNNCNPTKSMVSNGSALTFLKSIQATMVEEPEGYSVEAVKEITKKYTSDSVSKATTKNPNVIVVMDEAFSDLTSVGNLKTNKDVLPFYHSLKEDKNALTGLAYVSVFGGKTANSEYEFLTNDSKAFTPVASTPYQIYIKSSIPTFTMNLLDLGYKNPLAMHPFLGSGYNRKNVYDIMGFSKFITQDDFKDPKRVRNYISDEADFDRVISEYEAAKAKNDGPFYMFNVTMQNHSSYDADYPNLPKGITITDAKQKDSDAERYLNLAHVSDASLKKLVDYFKKVDEPTVIVFFGDHQPGLSDHFYESLMGIETTSLTDEQLMQKYKVPYMVWGNYDMKLETNKQNTSLSYLQSDVLKAIGMPMTGYNKFIQKFKKTIPIMNANGYWDNQGNFYTIEDKKSPHYDLIQQYNKLVFNHLLDTKNRVDEFFTLKK